MASSDQNGELPTLAESNALMAFLQSELLELEALSGSEEQEARSLLQQLEQQTTLLQALSQGHHSQQLPVQTELELAEQLDSLDAQLSQLEASLAAADASTLELLGQSTSRWMQAAQATAAPLPLAQGQATAASTIQPHGQAAPAGSSGSTTNTPTAQADPAAHSTSCGGADADCRSRHGLGADPVGITQDRHAAGQEKLVAPPRLEHSSEGDINVQTSTSKQS